MDARERFDLLVGRSQLLCKLTNFRVQRLVLLLRAREEQSAIPRAERVRDHALPLERLPDHVFALPRPHLHPGAHLRLRFGEPHRFDEVRPLLRVDARAPPFRAILRAILLTIFGAICSASAHTTRRAVHVTFRAMCVGLRVVVVVVGGRGSNAIGKDAELELGPEQREQRLKPACERRDVLKRFADDGASEGARHAQRGRGGQRLTQPHLEVDRLARKALALLRVG
mmetsp:Transcript_3920/g.8423  ORF Transcript_3920/g.8423 Transcript_3920/m.8423 type:complete len:227 (+) Transcript_3920:202-882(+)